jgi:hypothetical protein
VTHEGVGERTGESPGRQEGIPGRVAKRLADVDRVPTAVRAVLAHYARSGELDLAALSVRNRAEATIEDMTRAAYRPVEHAVAEAFDRDPEAVTFEYDTKLLLPAELTIARHYRELEDRAPDGFDPVSRTVSPGPLGSLTDRVLDRFVGADERKGKGKQSDEDTPVDPLDWPGTDGDPPPRPGEYGAGLDRRPGPGDVDPEFSGLVRAVERVERVTRLVVVALLDGDMRDAINDGEYDDFDVNFPVDDADRRRVAEIAQSTLRSDVEARFERFPDGVRAAYERAVGISEAHQDRDPRFRSLLVAVDGDRPTSAGGTTETGAAAGTATDQTVAVDDPHERIRREYRDAPFESEDPPAYLTDGDLDLPYLRTQYGRVGVIYEGMTEMYRAAGVEVPAAFERAIVLSIVGAQVWLDDVDDYAADARDGQLTPVTAEYALSGSKAEAYRRVVGVTDAYLDRAYEGAVSSGATLTAIAVEYIRRSGDPGVLPGSDRR